MREEDNKLHEKIMNEVYRHKAINGLYPKVIIVDQATLFKIRNLKDYAPAARQEELEDGDRYAGIELASFSHFSSKAAAERIEVY